MNCIPFDGFLFLRLLRAYVRVPDM